MKTNHSPKYIEREKTGTILFYLVKDSATLCINRIGRIKILILPILLMANAGNAQQMLAMNDNAVSLHSNEVITSDEPVANKKPAKKTDSVATLSGTAKTEPKYIANNEDKAMALVSDYFRGVDDADDNYKAKKSGKTAIMASTLIGGPIVGLIPTIVCSTTVPNNKNLNVPHSANVTNDAYMKGYRNEAHYIKRHNTWPRFILASVVWLAVVNIIAH